MRELFLFLVEGIVLAICTFFFLAFVVTFFVAAGMLWWNYLAEPIFAFVSNI